MKKGKESSLLELVGYYASLGFVIPAGAVAGYILGWYIDKWLHTFPILAIVWAFLGAVGGFIEVFKILKRAEEKADSENGGSAGISSK